MTDKRIPLTLFDCVKKRTVFESVKKQKKEMWFVQREKARESLR